MAKSRKKRKEQEEMLVDIVEAKEQAQDIFEKYQLAIIGAAAVMVLIIGGYLAYHFLYDSPREKTAMEQLFKAEFQFQRDSFAMALENPGGGYEGFLDIVENYSGTKAANLAKYYAGLSYLNLGRFEDAIAYLESYKASGKVTPITKFGALGDAYSELGQMDRAISNYEKAVRRGTDYLTPFYLNKLGLLCKYQGQNDKALKAFKQIKEDYPESLEAVEVDKYIAMLE
jgi:tetratricopeptide (TPR) repeat protein